MMRAPENASRRGAIAAALLGALLAACTGDGPTAVTAMPSTAPVPFLVSNPSVGSNTTPQGGAGGASASGDLAWVSLPVGTLPGASAVTILVRRSGSQTIALVSEGGFDPVAVPAQVGDTLQLTVQGPPAGAPSTYLAAVPPAARPRVVRTSPPRHKRDVALNAIIIVTFSEPMDGGSLTGAISLSSGGAPVPGSLVIPPQDGGVIRAEFVPAAPLARSTTYEIQVSTAALDREGEALDSAFRSDFTSTETAATPAPLFHTAVNLPQGLVLHPALVGQSLPPVQVTYQGCAAGCDSAYTGDVTLVLGAHPTGAALRGTVTARMVDGVATFADLAVDLEGIYSLVATAPGAVGDTSSGFEACAHLCWDWERALMPTPRSLVGVGVIGGTLYAVGGLDTAAAPSAAVEAYDPATDAWTPRAPMPTARYGFGIGVVDGIVYVAGGITAAGPTAAVEAYDPRTDTWTTRASLPSPTGFLGGGALRGRLYVVGGQRPDSTLLATVLAYDPATDQWSSRARLPAPRSHVAVAISGDLLYALEGMGDDNNVTVYDPMTDRWTVPTLGGWSGFNPVSLLPAAAAVPGMGIVIVGGADGSTYLRDPWGIGVFFDPTGSQYRLHLRWPAFSRRGSWLPSAGMVNGELYLVGYETLRFLP